MADFESPSPRRRRLGQELRRLRETTEMTGEEAAKLVGWSAAKLSRIENAKTLPTEDDVVKLLDLFGIDAVVLGDVLTLRKNATQKGWWEKYSAALDQGYIAYIGLEAEATVMRNWEPQVVPGLLQTEEYAQALLGNVIQPINQIPPVWSNARVEARIRRQHTRLFTQEPLMLLTVIDQAVLTRMVGDPAVMRKQLQHLAEISEREHVDVRVITRATQLPMATGPFVHFTFRDVPDAVYLEDLLGGRFIDGAEGVFVYERAFEHLAKAALSELASRQLIKETMAHWAA
ncbi:transcriptional regulator [Acrocarpospora phusangensis]|uniref:Transcriptional regulator n=1 Tax=Acrocarpospora phusangensis TaxID=1070424 RepID=A0A919UHV9_9ACTN|nr:helix-turn-helix transcriptional regulator [Acrocarpospora phusangensis]GIH22474.1 transcriptional regulator [Acrocarpospora phusangensis]